MKTMKCSTAASSACPLTWRDQQLSSSWLGSRRSAACASTRAFGWRLRQALSLLPSALQA